jgi:uncharacterized membrane protein YfcA
MAGGLGLGAVPLLLLVAAVGLAAATQGATGVGFTLVAAPCCALLLQGPDVIGTVARLALVVDVVLVVRHRRELDVHTARTYLWAAAAAVPIAVVAGIVLSSQLLVLGAATVTLAGAGALMILTRRPEGAGVPATVGGPAPRVAAGFAAGFLGVTTGLSGPPVALDAARQRMPAARTRGTLALFFAAVDFLAIVVHRSAVAWQPTALLLVPLALGLLAGQRAVGAVSEGKLRVAMLTLVCAAALGAIARLAW